VTIDDAENPGLPEGHAHCFVCGDRNPRSLGLSFHRVDGETVSSQFQAGPELQGYHGILHGGVIAALLDAAMTHCLSHQGVQAMTGELHVRFLRPIACDSLLEVRARVLAARPPLYRVKAELVHRSEIMARGEATFMQR
jgi:uncharacterized protein (TIGR00369 family)